MRPTLLIALAALLAACVSYEGDENSPYYSVPAGTRIALNAPLSIAPNQVGVFIQDGRVLPWQQVRQYYPYCKFEVYTLRDIARTVTPDEFTVRRTVQEHAHSAARGTPQHTQLAAFGGLRLGMFSDDDMDILVTFATRMYLRSERQPDVYRLTCAQWGHLPGDRHVTIDEMRQTLGSLLTLQLPSPRP